MFWNFSFNCSINVAFNRSYLIHSFCLSIDGSHQLEWMKYISFHSYAHIYAYMFMLEWLSIYTYYLQLSANCSDHASNVCRLSKHIQTATIMRWHVFELRHTRTTCTANEQFHSILDLSIEHKQRAFQLFSCGDQYQFAVINSI